MVAPGDQFEFKVEGRFLLTNEDSAKIWYTARVESGELDPSAVRAVYTALASELAFPVTQDHQLGRLIHAELVEDILPNAYQTNAIQENLQDVDKEVSSWINSRARNILSYFKGP